MRKYEGVRDQGSSFLHRTPMLTWHRQLLCWDRQGYYIAVPHVSVDTETKTTCITQGWPSSWAIRELHCTILHSKWFSALWTASLTNLVSLAPNICQQASAAKFWQISNLVSNGASIARGRGKWWFQTNVDRLITNESHQKKNDVLLVMKNKVYLVLVFKVHLLSPKVKNPNIFKISELIPKARPLYAGLCSHNCDIHPSTSEWHNIVEPALLWYFPEVRIRKEAEIGIA